MKTTSRTSTKTSSKTKPHPRHFIFPAISASGVAVAALFATLYINNSAIYMPEDISSWYGLAMHGLAGLAAGCIAVLALARFTVQWGSVSDTIGENGILVGYIRGKTDFDEREQAGEQFRQLNQALEERNRELEAERERWQGVVEGIADEVWVCDLEGKMSLINLPQTTAMGLEEFAGKTYAQILDEVEILNMDGSPRPANQAPLYRSLRGEIVRGEEMMIHRQTGRTRYRQFSSGPMHDASGKITGAVAIVRDITRVKEAEADRRVQAIQIELQKRLLEQREEERLQIARDLHDGPVQGLTGVTLALRGVLMDNRYPELALQLEAMQTDLQAQIGELRAFAGELRPPALDKFGLAKAIRSHLDSFQEKHPQLQIDLEENQVGELVPEIMRLALFRIYQESMTNIAKHAQATRARIQMTKTEEQFILEIHDDGIGFDIPDDWLELARNKHLGLVGMRERAEAIGGRLEVQSQKGSGTHVRVRVPLARTSSVHPTGSLWVPRNGERHDWDQ